jgi:hypothetical protein
MQIITLEVSIRTNDLWWREDSVCIYFLELAVCAAVRV